MDVDHRSVDNNDIPSQHRAHSQSSEVPSLLTVTQTAGKVIDYGHASRAKEETDSRETFKREQLSSERRVNQFPLPALAKGDKTERHQVNLKHAHLGKHGDQDYRRTDGDHRKSSRSPGREFPPPPKSRHLDRDYRCEGPKPRPSPKRGFEEPLRRSVPSFDSKPHGSGGGKKLPTPTMIRDFSSVAPKVFPHTCSLCHIQCDQEKDWGDHINTVNHISACRDLRNKYPDWKADFPSSWSGRYGSRTFWDPREHSSAHSRPHSYSPSRSPPQNTHREGPHPNRPYKRPYSPQRHPQSRHYPAGPPQPRGKRPHDYVTQPPGAESHHPPAKVGHSWRHEPLPAGKERLVYLTGIPKDASEEEVTSLVGSFGKINNVILIPSSGEQSDKDEAQKASVCMVKPEDAQNLASSTELFIRQQKLTASVAKVLCKTPRTCGNESSAQVGWSSLLVIQNVPHASNGSSEVQKLVRRFGTVIRSLVICEMATAAMALSVYKRFQAFPCIIQNNPLIFSRKADPKPSTQSKSSPAPPQAAENKIQDCDLDTAEKKTDGPKEENHPSGENPTHADVPPAEPAVPELPKNITREVENQLSDEAASGTSSQFSNAAASNEGEEEARPQEDKRVKVRAEESKEQAEAPKTPEKEQKGKETRKESEAREAKERDRQSWEKEKVQGERDRTERARRERDRREEKRKERAKVDRKSTSAVRSSSKSQKAEKQSSPSADPTRMETEEDFDPFPFNMCDFVTVDEVGDGDAVGATVDPDNRTAEREHTPPVQASPRDSEPTVEPPSPPAETENKAAAESCVGGGQRPGEGERTSNSSAPGREAQQNQEVDSQHGKEEQDEAERLKGPAEEVTPAVGSAKVAADESQSDAQRVKEKVSAASPANSSSPLPPFSPHNPVGMEFLAPKTGFFCKACNRFFSGAKEAEIAHCKTRKHYDNVKVYLRRNVLKSSPQPADSSPGLRLGATKQFLPQHFESPARGDAGERHRRDGDAFPEDADPRSVSRRRISSQRPIESGRHRPQARRRAAVPPRATAPADGGWVLMASVPPRRYTLSGPSSSSPPPPLCPVHQRGLEFFCHTDGVCVCSACVDRAEHRGHSVSPAKREWQIKKSQLGISEMELKGLLSEREKKAEEIQESLKAIQAAAESQTDGAMCAFSKLISSVESCQTDVLEVIELSRRAAEHRAQSLLKELEEELTELRKRSAALSQLSRSEDYVHFLKVGGSSSPTKTPVTVFCPSPRAFPVTESPFFPVLQTFPGLSAHPQTKDWSGVGLASELTSGAALRTVSHVMEQIQEEMQRLPESCQRILLDQSAPRTNPSKRVMAAGEIKRVQEYAADITLDPYTAHPRLIISPDGKQVHCGERHQQIPDNPERFDRVVCVLAHQGFSSGRHYWEVGRRDGGGVTWGSLTFTCRLSSQVDVGGKTDWDLGVASRSVNRKGKITVSPAHGYWFLSLRDQSEYAFRTEPSTSLALSIRPSRIGIYVDFEKGVVSFYNVEARLLIFTFADAFPDTIYPFFSPCTNKSGRNEAPLIIRPVAKTE
ncbi:unnamed protein product [Tetraodon nigroviridis]|uniref:(spotted green pufferfish) hypothetical protein n=1 Tax=Tetraodon nigroviridis TaxID=99883 RepID=Q4RZS9_TETNG|nr:unnamed protein product [Tetraodon nigroviridis]